MWGGGGRGEEGEERRGRRKMAKQSKQDLPHAYIHLRWIRGNMHYLLFYLLVPNNTCCPHYCTMHCYTPCTWLTALLVINNGIPVTATTKPLTDQWQKVPSKDQQEQRPEERLSRNRGQRNDSAGTEDRRMTDMSKARE